MSEQPHNESSEVMDDPTFAESVRQGHEPSQLHLRGIVLAGAALLLFTAGTMGVVALVLKTDANPNASRVSASEQWRRSATNPGVVPNQAHERRQQTATNEAALNSYGWTDHETTWLTSPLTEPCNCSPNVS